MPRHPRTFVLEYPHHIVQRGHDRNAVFVEPTDYRFYLDNLNEQKQALGIEVLAYCLMTNHVHLVLRPMCDKNSLSQLMRILAARQTRYTNKLETRSGTLWEGRFKCSVVDTDAYLLACCRYVDLNPVRACIVTDPDAYEWSSYRGLAGIAKDALVDCETVYGILDFDASVPGKTYQAFVQKGVTEEELVLIRAAVQRNQLTGSSRFIEEMKYKLGRRVHARGRGRPKK